MSDNIDNRIVQMQFENSQFEKGVAESLKSLEKLKESLQLEKAAEGLRRLQQAGDSFSLANVSNGVSELQERFSFFGTFAARIIENLADTVYNKLGAAIKDVTVGQIGAGWQKYADDTKAVQTIMFATGDNIENVEAELQKLTWFTDETSYSYRDMVSNISKFTSMNIPLADARIQMQGIATWAASAGQGATEASRAMYNISQAIGAGFMKKIDWKSIENANMATADFKKNAIDTAIALGKLNKQGQIQKGKSVITVGVDNFAETLQAGWFDKDVMETVFKRYGDFAEKVQQLSDELNISTSDAMEMLAGQCELFSENAFRAAQEAKTFSEAIEALRDATSTKWLNIFKLIFGNYEEAKVLWTKLANDLYEIFVDPLDVLLDELRKWHNPDIAGDGFGSYKDFLEGIYGIMDGLKGILITVRDAFGTLIPDITVERLQAFSLRVKEFGTNFRAAFGLPEEEEKEVVDSVENVKEAIDDLSDSGEKLEDVKDKTNDIIEELKRGARGEEVKAMQEKLMALGYELPNFGADSIWGPETDAAFKQFQRDTGMAIDGVYDEAAKQSLEEAFKLGEVQKKFEDLERSLKIGDKGEDVKTLQMRLMELGYDLPNYGADGIWGPETEAAFKKWQEEYDVTADGIYDLEDHLKMKEKLGFKDEVKEIEEVTKNTEEASEEVGKYGNKLDNIKSIMGGVAAVGGILCKMLGFVGKVFGLVWNAATPLVEAFISVGAAIGDCFISLNNWLDESGVMEQWLESVKEWLKPFADWIQNAADSMLTFFGITKDNTGEAMTFSKMWKSIKENLKKSEFISRLSTAFEGLKASITRVKAILKPTFDSIKEWFGGKFKSVGDGASSIFGKIKTAIQDFIINGVNKLHYFVNRLPLTVLKIKNFFAKLKISEHFNTIKESFIGFFKGDFKGMLSNLSDTTRSKVINALTNVREFFIRLKDGIVQTWSTVKNLFQGKISIKDIWEKIKTFFINLWSTIKTSLGDAGKKIGDTAKVILAWAPSVLLLVFVLVKLYKFIKTITDTIHNFSEFFKNKNKKEPESVSNQILKIAGAIGIIAASIFVLGQMPIGNFGKGLLAIAVIVAALISFVVICKRMENSKETSEAIEKLGKGLFRIAKAIGILSLSIGLLSVLPAAMFWKAYARLAAIIALLLGMVYVFNKINKDGQKLKTDGLLKLSGAILMLTMTIPLLGVLTKGFFDRAFARLATMMATMLIFVYALKEIFKEGKGLEIKGIFAISAAISLLSVVLLLIGFLPEKVMKKGFIGLIAMMAMMGIFIYALRDTTNNAKGLNSKGILPIVGAIGVLSLIAAIIGILPFETLKKGIVGLAAIMLLFGVFINQTVKLAETDGKNVLKIIPMVIALVVLGESFSLFAAAMQDVSWDTLGKTIIALASILIVFAAIVKIISKNDIKDGKLKPTIGAVFSVALLGAAFVLLAKQMKKIKLFTFVKTLISFGAILIAFSAITKTLSKANIKSASFAGILGGVLLLGAIGAGFVILSGYVKDIDGNTLAKTLLSFGTVVVSAVVLSKALSGSSMNIGSGLAFILSMAGLVGAMFGLATALQMVNGIDTGTIDSFGTALSKVIGISGIVGTIAGGVGAGKAFLGIVAIAAGIGVVMAAFSALLSIDGVQEFFESGASKIGAIVGNFVGSMKAAELSSFNDAIKEIEGVNSTTDEKVQSAIDAAQQLADFAEGLPGYDTLTLIGSSLFGVDTPLKAFSKDMVSFGRGFNSFATNINSIDNLEQEGEGGLSAKANTAIAIAEAVKIFAEGLDQYPIPTNIAGILVTNTPLGQFSNDIQKFGNGFNQFATEINSIENLEGEDTGSLTSKANTAIAIAESIKTFAEGLENYPVPTNIAGILITNTPLGQFSNDIQKFGKGFNSYAAEINEITNLEGSEEGSLSSKTSTAIEIAKSIKEFADTLANYPVPDNVGEVLVSNTPLGQFSKDIKKFGKGFNSYAAEINEIDNLESSGEGGLSSKTSTAIEIAKSIKEFADTLANYPVPETVGDLLISNTALGQFSKDIQKFGTGFNSYAAEINEIDNLDGEGEGSLTSKTTAAMAIAKSISDFGSTLENNTITDAIVSKLTGGGPLASFSGDMAKFAEKFNKYSETMGGITAKEKTVKKRTDNAIGIATKIAEFCVSVSAMDIEQKAGLIQGWFTNDTKTETVIDTVGSLADSMHANVDKFKGISEGTFVSDVEAAIAGLSSVAGFLTDLTGTDESIDLTKYYDTTTALSQFGTDIQNFDVATHGIDIKAIASIMDAYRRFFSFFSKESAGGQDGAADIFGGVDTTTIANSFTAVLTGIDAAITSNKDNLQLSGESIGNDILSGFLITDLTVLAEFITSITSKLDSYKSDFEEVGKNFDIGLFWGVLNYQHLPVDAAVYVARKMIEAMKSIFIMASPSKATQQIGQYFTEGLAIGANAKVGDATNAADNVANAMLDTAKGPLKTLSQLLAEDIDDTPVIAPILDLTNARQQAATIGDLFGNAKTGVELTNTLATRATLDTEGKTIINPKQVEMDGKYNYGNNLDQLKEALKNMSPKEVVDELQGLSDKFGSFAEAATNLKMVLDTGTLVGEISSMIDLRMGRDVALRERGN